MAAFLSTMHVVSYHAKRKAPGLLNAWADAVPSPAAVVAFHRMVR